MLSYQSPRKNVAVRTFTKKTFMTTKQLVEAYLNRVKEQSDWQTFIAPDVRFKSPVPSTSGGREALLEAGSRFFQMVENLEVKHLISDGEKANAWVEYSLCLQNGKRCNCLVSELFEVRNDQIVSFAIMFDTLALKLLRES